MSLLRLGRPIALRVASCAISRAVQQCNVLPKLGARAVPWAVQSPHSKFYSQDLGGSKMYSFDEIKSFVDKPDPNRILVDSREAAELRATGTIPGSLNIPVKSKPDSFFITAEEFEDRFGFERPSKDQEVVFYCKSGVRSRAAAELARQAGWQNVAEYQGSWLDWDKNGGAKQGGQ